MKKIKVTIQQILSTDEIDLEVPDDYTEEDLYEAARNQYMTPEECSDYINLHCKYTDKQCTNWFVDDYIVIDEM